ncbi:hypothetical protein P170DRAFT_240092 [Aspergillus steynii IBT 23096]|uniref:Uncharacterized protein n=1 Tax=Aspergillus steynii IBT 23096 TaxID=1392250 RepID=A0A2I2G3C9_9EURO|nr:uncharacterized protein P170DRAFT_240092 [Aspergillus steynii IBT 23096]PLB47382.1 hypothetical protein P170DRAFT_240092 [Aspergillus steynii IBT 23096]
MQICRLIGRTYSGSASGRSLRLAVLGWVIKGGCTEEGKERLRRLDAGWEIEDVLCTEYEGRGKAFGLIILWIGMILKVFFLKGKENK